MDRVLKIIGLVVLAWLAIGLVGAVLGFLVKAVFWVAVIAGGVYAVGAITANRRQVRSHR
ncbi:hypothetical protein [Nakamurella endophytica]|uniref:Uncharacterized protein n=1 Tax=Nakamurella endophytica TaxID=1748367 RepID=A0A917WJT8_9ACTN|nr:hypothetical protein [Nakamurella endophytica]GGM08762.1 hypothetical protein GCM10011594_30830 [Nakamurella endophytica]